MLSPWHYVIAFPAALLLVNGLPHFLHGISGKTFPTPFVGGPPNLDGPTRNVVWGIINLVAGGLFLAWISPDLGNAGLVAELLIVGSLAAIGMSMVMSRTTPRR